MDNDLYFKNKYYKYKMKYHKLKQSGGMFPLHTIDEGKTYYIKNVETGTYLRYSKTKDNLYHGEKKEPGKKFKFIKVKEDCFRIESQYDSNKKVISYDKKSKTGILEEYKGKGNQVFQIRKNPDSDCYKIVNCESELSLKISESTGEVKLDKDRDNSKKQCFILEEVSTEPVPPPPQPPAPPPPQPPVPPPPQPPAPPPRRARPYDVATGVINTATLQRITDLPELGTPQDKSAMVWGALNRAGVINQIPEEIRLRYILSNPIMNNGNPIGNELACNFIRNYVGLAQNRDWFLNTLPLLGLPGGAGGGDAP